MSGIIKLSLKSGGLFGNIVTFVDYDGTVLSKQGIQIGGTAIAPPIPIVSGMSFIGWNQSLTNIQSDMVIGAIRQSDDGNVINIKLNSTTGLTPTLNLINMSGVLTINWGDGNSDIFSGSNLSITHSYLTHGNYSIKIYSTGTFKLGWGGASNRLLSNYNESIVSIKLSENVIGINANSLDNAMNLETINIPNTVTSIGSFAFNLCKKLKSIVLPNNAYNAILTSTFAYCSSMKSVSIGSNIITVGSQAFYACRNLSNFTIPNSVQTISIQAFASCNILNCKMPTSATVIDSNAFDGTKVKSPLIIPIGITTIGGYVFRNNYELEIVQFLGNITRVRNYCLDSCWNLRTLDFPASLNGVSIGIEANAFANADNILDYYFRGTTPPPLANVNAFSSIGKLTRIHVPASSVNSYKTATNWITYANYIIGDL